MLSLKFLRRFIFLGIALCIYGAPTNSFAQDADAPVKDPEPLIEIKSTASEDAKIDARIENIFSKIDGIKGVDVKVESGVVTLSGDVANDAQAVDAKDIAIRTAGVVTVEDKINRTLDIRSNVTPMITDFQSKFSTFMRALPLILVALIIFLIFALLGNRLVRLTKIWRKIAPNPFLADLLAQASRLVMLAAGAILALNLLGASKFVTTILGGAGVMGIAIGFAVRDSLENYISSIMLSLRQPFRANDHVVINSHEGIVIRLTSRATILMTQDGNHLRIPNSVVFKGIILNYSTNPERRFDFDLSIEAKDNPITAIKTGLKAIKAQDFILKDPAPTAAIKTAGESKIIIKFTGWIDQVETGFGKARSLTIQSVMQALEGKKIDAKAAKKIAEDTAPDTQLTAKVAKERAQDIDQNLLDKSRPTE